MNLGMMKSERRIDAEEASKRTGLPVGELFARVARAELKMGKDLRFAESDIEFLALQSRYERLQRSYPSPGDPPPGGSDPVSVLGEPGAVAEAASFIPVRAHAKEAGGGSPLPSPGSSGKGKAA